MPFIICVLSRHRCGGLLVIHDFETIEKSYFTIDFIFAGSINEGGNEMKKKSELMKMVAIISFTLLVTNAVACGSSLSLSDTSNEESSGTEGEDSSQDGKAEQAQMLIYI